MAAKSKDSNESSFYADLGKCIAFYRKQHGANQEVLGKAVKLSRTSITNIEKGRQPVAIYHVLQICEFLGIELTTLISKDPCVKALKSKEYLAIKKIDDMQKKMKSIKKLMKHL